MIMLKSGISKLKKVWLRGCSGFEHGCVTDNQKHLANPRLEQLLATEGQDSATATNDF
jgi:hypothetical protein